MSGLEMLDLLSPARPSAMRQAAQQRFAPANGVAGQTSFADFLQQQITLGTGAQGASVQGATAVDAASAGATGQTALAAKLQAHNSQVQASPSLPYRSSRSSLLDLQDLGSSINAVQAASPTFGDPSAGTIA